MCGINLISGVASSKATPALRNMLAICEHRGPDSTSTLGIEDIFMGFNRLEIVGGSSGKQPIESEDGSIVVMGNGEIFNHKELRRSHAKSHPYKTDSDIEVILHLYEENGLEFIGHLEGQFSFVIYDKRKNKIILARDRWGITPLFYAVKNGQLVVSSSVRAIIRSKIIGDITLDPLGIAESWNLYGPTPPRTCFNSISQLPPGHYAEYDLVTGELTTIPCWNELKNERNLQTILRNSVAARLQGEQGPGVYVSGGVDSSIIAALVKQLSPKVPTLFSISFEDAAFDESPFQRMLAKHLNCELRTVRINKNMIIANIAKCVNFTESPLIRTAPVPMMLLSEEVRRAGIKFVLCGEGADELFAGYPVFAKGKSSVAEKWDALSGFNGCFAYDVAEGLQQNYEAITNRGSNLTNLRHQEIDTKLSRYLLANQGDRVAMANSVEQRFPFLDNAVGAFAFSLSSDELIEGGEGKQKLRKAFANLLPEELIQRKKQGYLTPDLQVVKQLRGDEDFKEALSAEQCQKVGIFKPASIKALMNDITDETKARFLLFAYTTHILHQTFIEESI